MRCALDPLCSLRPCTHSRTLTMMHEMQPTTAHTPLPCRLIAAIGLDLLGSSPMHRCWRSPVQLQRGAQAAAVPTHLTAHPAAAAAAASASLLAHASPRACRLHTLSAVWRPRRSHTALARSQARPASATPPSACVVAPLGHTRRQLFGFGRPERVTLTERRIVPSEHSTHSHIEPARGAAAEAAVHAAAHVRRSCVSLHGASMRLMVVQVPRVCVFRCGAGRRFLPRVRSLLLGVARHSPSGSDDHGGGIDHRISHLHRSIHIAHRIRTAQIDSNSQRPVVRIWTPHFDVEFPTRPKECGSMLRRV